MGIGEIKEMLGREFFDPERSTTHDVVRHAIIPMSLQGVLPAEEGEEILLWTEDAGVTFESAFERRSLHQADSVMLCSEVPGERRKPYQVRTTFPNFPEHLLSRLRSQQHGIAYASMVNQLKPVFALKMVTHAWGNVFRSLDTGASEVRYACRCMIHGCVAPDERTLEL